MGATLSGVLVALQLDLVVAFGARLLHPVGLAALFRTTATAGLTGLLCWVVCALVTRAISRSALRPYTALANHFERLADGHVDGPLDLRGAAPAVRRLARAAVVFRQRELAGRRSEADLQARYDGLCQEHADERRLLMGMLMRGRLDPGDRSPVPQPAEPAASPGFDPPDSSAVHDAVDRPARDALRVVDLTGRLHSPARAVEATPTAERIIPDLMSLDFAFVRR